MLGLGWMRANYQKRKKKLNIKIKLSLDWFYSKLKIFWIFF